MFKNLRYLGQHNITLWEIIRIARQLRAGGTEITPTNIVASLSRARALPGIDIERLLEILEALMPLILLIISMF